MNYWDIYFNLIFLDGSQPYYSWLFPFDFYKPKSLNKPKT